MINIILTGLNGYGAHFIPELLEENTEYCLKAVVSRNAKKSCHYGELSSRGVAIYTSLEEALFHERADLVIITTPMHIHYREVMAAVRAGAHVYCEKPLAPTIDECLAIKEAAKKAGVIVAVGFQWSFSNGIRKLKHDILEGRYGRIKRIKTMASLSRKKSYFAESSWKGRNTLPDGTCVLESVMSNGAAHFLHNLFFLCGDTMETSGYPALMEGEAYRAYPVEGLDTVMLRMETKKGEELLYYATLAAKESYPAQFEVELERATASYPVGKEKKIKVEERSGEAYWYDCPDDMRFSHFKDVVAAISDGKSISCGVDAVLPEVIAVNVAAERIRVWKFPKEMVAEDKTNIYAHHIDEILKNCYEQAALPNELSYPFSKRGARTSIGTYTHFSGMYPVGDE